MMDEKKSFEELMSFIEEMGGWEELDEADLESVRQRVKKNGRKRLAKSL